MSYQLLDGYNFKLDPRIELVRAYRDFYGRGWAPEIKDNISARFKDNSFWITTENKPDAELLPIDFVRINSNGEFYHKYPDILPPKSIGVHKAIYELFDNAKFCYELHSLDTSLVYNLISRLLLTYKDTLPSLLTDNKLCISLENISSIPIFNNSIYAKQTSNSVKAYFSINAAQTPILIVRNYCIIIWANDLETIQKYAEALRFIVDSMKESEVLTHKRNRSIPTKVSMV